MASIKCSSEYFPFCNLKTDIVYRSYHPAVDRQVTLCQVPGGKDTVPVLTRGYNLLFREVFHEIVDYFRGPSDFRNLSFVKKHGTVCNFIDDS